MHYEPQTVPVAGLFLFTRPFFTSVDREAEDVELRQAEDCLLMREAGQDDFDMSR